MPNNNQQHCMTFKINEDGSHNAAEIADFVKAESWDVKGDKLTLFNLVLVGKAQFSATNGEDIFISGLNSEQQIEQEKKITLGDVKNNIHHQHEFFSDERNKFVVQLKLTDGAVVTEFHSNKDHAVILAYQSASNYLQYKTNQSSNNGNGTTPTQDLLELKNDESVKSPEAPCITQARTGGSVGECIHRSKLLENRENAYLLTQLLNTPNINSELRKKAEEKMTALLDQLI